jgi:hypothetical protein
MSGGRPCPARGRRELREDRHPKETMPEADNDNNAAVGRGWFAAAHLVEDGPGPETRCSAAIFRLFGGKRTHGDHGRDGRN